MGKPPDATDDNKKVARRMFKASPAQASKPVPVMRTLQEDLATMMAVPQLWPAVGTRQAVHLQEPAYASWRIRYRHKDATAANKKLAQVMFQAWSAQASKPGYRPAAPKPTPANQVTPAP